VLNGLRTVSEAYPQPKLCIGGAWLGPEGRATQPVLNPATGEALAELPLATPADLDRALEAAARGFATWRHSTADERSGVLRGAARLLRERVDSIARNATLEEGKTLPETHMETLVAAGLFDFYAEEARRIYGRVLVRPVGRRSLVVKAPVGPVAAFAPWNFPVGNPARKLGAAIGAGVPASSSLPRKRPRRAWRWCRRSSTRLPEGVASRVRYPDEVSTHLLASPVIRKLSFTGSVPVGKHLMRLAAANMQRTTMELGGHAPVLVFADADLDRTLDLMVTGKYRNAGQVCVSPTRFYVQRSRYREFVDRFTAGAAALKVGDGLEEGVQMGPMANARRPQSIAALIREAIDCGATLNTGGERIGQNMGQRMGQRGFFFSPTVLSDVPESARIMNEEPFRPGRADQPVRGLLRGDRFGQPPALRASGIRLYHLG
jgi:succinate-semialdehyde dehydrogenase/glutarate-semialdehyde dehydrogenase